MKKKKKRKKEKFYNKIKTLYWSLPAWQLADISPHIKHLSKLWVLYFSYYQLTTLPDEIGEMRELVWLNVGHKQLTVLSSHI